MKSLPLVFLFSILSAGPAVAGTKQIAAAGYALPADRPVTVVVMTPDVQVGMLTVTGTRETNVDWTAKSYGYFEAALRAGPSRLPTQWRMLEAPGTDTAKMVADYAALDRAVAGAIVAHKFKGPKLPTKRDRFDWSLGPGAQRLGELTGSNYALFFHSRDNFGTPGRKAAQAAGIFGCVMIGLCAIPSGGEHYAYVSLVDLSTGNVVWFNMLSGSKGDVRGEVGAKATVAALMQTLPTRPGQRMAEPGQ